MYLPRYCLAALLLLSSISIMADPSAWEAVREGRAMVILRHAYAPGIGDPAHFRLDDCSTQRNLNAQGREESISWGKYLSEKGLGSATVYSSRWCRAVDTAKGFQLGAVRPVPELDSFFQHQDQAQTQMQALRKLIAGLPAGEPIIMVSHQVNITALTGVFPASGEALILALPLTEPPSLMARQPAPQN